MKKANGEKLYLWEILVPVNTNDGEPYNLSAHNTWDIEVRKILGDTTILKGASSRWIIAGDTFNEEMIPARVFCTYDQMITIADISSRHYSLEEVRFYRVSKHVFVQKY